MKKALSIKKTSVFTIKAPLIYPFRTALGQHDHLENIIFGLELGDGTKGFGEAAIAPHITGEDVKTTGCNLKAAGGALAGKDASEYLRLSSEINERLPRNKSAVAAIEIALMDALTRRWKIPLWKFFGNKPTRISSDITLVISSLAQTEGAIRKFYRQGFRAFKIKIGRDQDLDHQRVLAVKRLAPGASIYLDANQGYSLRDTLRFLRSLKRAGVTPALIEQPVPKSDFEGLKKVSRSGGVLVCADESASSVEDVMKIIRCRAAGVINIKLMKFGIFKALEAYVLAKASGMRLMIGGMMESSCAMMAAAHLAAGLGGFDYIDLDCPFFIKKGWEKNPYLNAQGIYDVKKVKYGTGIIPAKR